MHACMYVCMYMYVCVCACMYVCIILFIHSLKSSKTHSSLFSIWSIIFDETEENRLVLSVVVSVAVSVASQSIQSLRWEVGMASKVIKFSQRNGLLFGLNISWGTTRPSDRSATGYQWILTAWKYIWKLTVEDNLLYSVRSGTAHRHRSFQTRRSFLFTSEPALQRQWEIQQEWRY